MIFFSSVKMAWESIRSNKMRSFLTMLGIIIGVAAVIILVSLVQGLSSQVSSMFESMGTTGVSVSAFRSTKQEALHIKTSRILCGSTRTK